MNIQLRQMVVTDWPHVATIYAQGLETGNATFQQEAPKWEDWDNGHLTSCRIVALAGNEIAGWAALSPVSSRCVYAGVAEISLYIGTIYRGRKIGSQLLEALIVQSEASGIWTLQAGIFPENIASLALHRKSGFREVGFREKIGQMNGVWRDTVLMEKRSEVVCV